MMRLVSLYEEEGRPELPFYHVKTQQEGNPLRKAFSDS